MVSRSLLQAEPDIGRALYRSCRPIEAQRYRDGRLLVVVGCWWAEDQRFLDAESTRLRLDNSLGTLFADRLVTTIVRWPGGMAAAAPEEEDADIPAPDVLSGLPDEAREEAAKCESAIQRLFFARAYARGLRLQCQYPVLNYRLDFALPERHCGAEVMGWDWRVGPLRGPERGERLEQIERFGWQVTMFSGSQVLTDPDRCVGRLVELAGPGRPETGRRSPAPRATGPSVTRYDPRRGQSRRP